MPDPPHRTVRQALAELRSNPYARPWLVLVNGSIVEFVVDADGQSSFRLTPTADDSNPVDAPYDDWRVASIQRRGVRSGRWRHARLELLCDGVVVFSGHVVRCNGRPLV